jgi:hypothetical protein
MSLINNIKIVKLYKITIKKIFIIVKKNLQKRKISKKKILKMDKMNPSKRKS